MAGRNSARPWRCAVGGIADQIVDGESGVLPPDPADLGAFGSAVTALLADPERRGTMGERAHERVVERFLPDMQPSQWSHLLEGLLAGPD
jgi:trehalose synthase